MFKQAIRNDTNLRVVSRVVRGMPATDGAGVELTRVIAQPALPMLDPFLLLDAFRSDRPGDYIAGFPAHPHRGFETVTYMLAGRMRHEDSEGHSGVIGPGGVQWMTAASGIIHSEMPQQEDGLLWGFQLWVNLPAARKMERPRYQNIEPGEIPEVKLGQATVRVVAGTLEGTRGPVQQVETDPVYWDVRCTHPARFSLPLPPQHQAFIYVYQGSVRIGAAIQPVSGQQLVLLSTGECLDIAVDRSVGLICVAGRPLAEPIARYGPFVMNRREEIEQAFEDYRQGRLVRHRAP